MSGTIDLSDPVALIESIDEEAVRAQISEERGKAAAIETRIAALEALLKIATIRREGPPKRRGRVAGSKNKPRGEAVVVKPPVVVPTGDVAPVVEVNVLRPPGSARVQSSPPAAVPVVKPAAEFVPPRPVEKFTARPTGNQRSEVAANIAAYLVKVGSGTPREIAGVIGYSVAVVSTTLEGNERFEKRLGDNWSLRRAEED